MALRPCTSCHRHVASPARQCPFCEAPLEPAPAPSAPTSVARLTRAAVFYLGASLASVGCGGDSSGNTVQPYGAPPDPPPEPPPEEGPPAEDDARADEGAPVQAYGAPPIEEAEAPPDEGAPVPAYGAPAPDDGPTLTPIAPPYGAPPADFDNIV